MTTPPTEQQLDEIETRAAARRTALSGWINCYSPLSEQEALEGAEVVLEEDVPALLAEVRRLRAELRIGAPWTCHVCGKENHRDVCLICETDRPDPELAASVPPGAPVSPSQPSSVSESAQSPTGATEGRLGDLPSTEDLAAADNPTHLRWGLNDVLWSDDDSVIVMLSGPDREAYWLELDPEQAAVLREDLAGPPAVETHIVADDSSDPEHTDDCPGCATSA